MSKITSTKDMQIDYAKVVVYGPPGAGKTTFGATFPDALILSAESGLLSIRDKDIDTWTIDKWEDLEEAFGFLRRGEHEYKTAVSYTHLRAHETKANLVCRLLLEKKKKKTQQKITY